MARLSLGQRRAPAFLRHVSYLALGAVVSQAVLLVVTIALTRLYTPHEFGEFAIALSLATILAALATLRLEMAVPLAEDDREASALAAAATLFAVVVAMGLLAVLAILAAVTGRPWSAFGAGASVWLVPLAVAALGALASARMLRSRRNDFAKVGRDRITAAVVQGVGQLAASPLGALGLSAGFVASTVWNAVSLSRGAGLRGIGSLSSCLATAAKWRNFSMLLLLPSVLNTATVGAVAPAVALFYGVASSGLFTFAFRILALPATIVGQAVGAAFFPKVAELERNGVDLTSRVHRAVTALTMLGVPVFGLVVLLGPELFGGVFGSEWRAAGSMSAVLAPWLAVAFVSSPLSTLMMVKDQLRRLLVLSVVETVSRLGALSAGLLDGRPMTGIAAYSFAGVVICLYSVRWSLRLAGSSLRAWLRISRGYLLTICAAYPALLAAKGHLPGPVFVLMATALTLLLLVWAAAWLYRHSFSGRPSGPVTGGAPRREATAPSSTMASLP